MRKPGEISTRNSLHCDATITASKIAKELFKHRYLSGYVSLCDNNNNKKPGLSGTEFFLAARARRRLESPYYFFYLFDSTYSLHFTLNIWAKLQVFPQLFRERPVDAKELHSIQSRLDDMHFRGRRTQSRIQQSLS